MKQKIAKTAYKVILGLFLLSVTAVACNNKTKEKETVDSAANRPTDPGDKMAPDNNSMAPDSTKIDSADNRPTNPGD